VLVERQRVDHQGAPEQVHVLSDVSQAVGPAEVEHAPSSPGLMDSESDTRSRSAASIYHRCL
jgi:hypothetical protein